MEETELRHAIAQHHAECFGWALACCGRNRAEAEDVLQTSYLKILDGRARFDERSTLKTWMFGVIRRTSMDEQRRRLLRWTITTRHETSAQATVEQPGTEAIEQARRNSELLTALAALSRRQCEVLQLVFYHDMTIEQAAHIMNVSLGSARTHYERGKARLRTLLGEQP